MNRPLWMGHKLWKDMLEGILFMMLLVMADVVLMMAIAYWYDWRLGEKVKKRLQMWATKALKWASEMFRE